MARIVKLTRGHEPLSFPAMEAKALPSGRRELTKAQNRETILAAARQVFAAAGFCRRHGARHHPRHAAGFRHLLQLFQVQGGSVPGACATRRRCALRPRLREARAWPRQRRRNSSRQAFAAFFCVRGGKRADRRAEPEPFRMDSPEVLAGFAELQGRHRGRHGARPDCPEADCGLLAAALAGVAFELGGRRSRPAPMSRR